MQVIDVLIVIEHKAREFESACLLKVAFESHGMEVVIESIYPNKESLPFRYRAKIIIVPWAYSNRDMDYLESFFYTSPYAVMINLHHEQYSGQDEDTTCLPSGRAKDLCHVSWGPKFTESLLGCGCKENSIITSGNIRLDFYKPKFRKLSLSKTELSNSFKINEKRRWVLFIANGYHLMDEATLERVSKIDANVLEKKEISDSCRKSFLSMAHRYLNCNSDVVFIYRPHPVFADQDRRSSDLMSLCRSHPDHFMVIPDLPIRDWLLAVDACISFHSTSVVECCAANVPYYLFRTKKLPERLDYAFLKDYDNIITDYDGFIRALSSTAAYSDESIKKKLSAYYVSTDHFAYEQIVSFALAQLTESRRHSYRRGPLFHVYLKSVAKAFMGALAQLPFVRKAMADSSDARWFRLLGVGEDAFTQQDVSNECSLIRNALGE